MRIRLIDSNLREDLALHFERAGFAVQPLGEILEIRRPDAPSDVQARREIDLHLAVWRALNPDVLIEVLDG
jgi:hypothetical protein